MARALELVRALVRWGAAHPALMALAPFVPVVALWALVAASGMFPAVFFPGPWEVVRIFGSLTWKGILPKYLEDSLVRLAVGAGAGVALGIPRSSARPGPV